MQHVCDAGRKGVCVFVCVRVCVFAHLICMSPVALPMPSVTGMACGQAEMVRELLSTRKELVALRQRLGVRLKLCMGITPNHTKISIMSPVSLTQTSQGTLALARVARVLHKAQT